MSYQPSRERQRLFWSEIRSGRTVEEAASAVGLSVRAGHHWVSKAGGMPPLQLCPPTGRHLTRADRETIFDGLMAGDSYAEIGRTIGRPTSTVTRELAANRFNPSRLRAVPS